MNILVIDSASSLEIIAAGNGVRTVELCEPVTVSHSATLIYSIDACLKKIDLSPRDLDCLAVGVGPGSFTGIRIAVSTARMLAQVLGKPLVGIATPLLFAVSAGAREKENILVAFDAKKERVFGALYRRGEGPLVMEEIVPPGDYPIGHLIDRTDRSGTTHLLGDGIDKYRDAAESLKHGVIPPHFAPRGDRICALALDILRRGTAGDYNDVVPCYARKSDAETAKEMKEGR